MKKNSFKSYSSPSFISQGLSSASEKKIFFKCYLWITALTYSAFTQGLGIRIQFSSLPYLISWFFSSSSLEYAYFAIKLNISVWTSPTSLATTLASIWQDICGLLFCVFSCYNVLHYLTGFKVIKQLGSQREALSCTWGVFSFLGIFKASFDFGGLSCAWTQFEMWGGGRKGLLNITFFFLSEGCPPPFFSFSALALPSSFHVPLISRSAAVTAPLLLGMRMPQSLNLHITQSTLNE